MRFLTFAFCAIVFGCAATAFGSEPVRHSTLAPKPLAVSTLPCDCNPCTCDPLACTCAGCEVGCHKKGGASAASMQDMLYSVGAIDTQAVGQGVATYCVDAYGNRVPCNQVQQVVYQTPMERRPPQPAPIAASNVCPCCGMEMTEKQMAAMKAKQTAALPPVQYAAPVQCAAPVQTYAPVVTYSAGACADGSCSSGAGGGCGSGGGRRGLFGRRR